MTPQQKIYMKRLEIAESSKEFYSRARNTIKETGMIKPGERILAAVSGGPDSMTMLFVLHSLASELGFEIGVGHVNHCLRGAESDGDEKFVEEITKRLGIPLHKTRVDAEAYRIEHRLSPEEAAREVRFAFLEQAMNDFKYLKIATAHNADDNAELVLMNLIRGTGPDGLEGMRLTCAETKKIRPLLNFYRREIESFIEKNDIPFRIDSTNSDEHFLRNRIRNNLFPHIENRFNGKIKEALNRLSNIVSSENDYMEKEAAKSFAKAAKIKEPGLIRIDPAEILSMHEAVSRRVLRMAVRKLKGDLKRISHTHIDGVLRLAAKDYDGEIHIPGRIRILKERGILYLRQEEHYLRLSRTIDNYDYFIDYLSDLPNEMDIPESAMKIRIRMALDGEADSTSLSGADRIFMEKEAVILPLVIRNARPGDRFMPMGMDGTKTVMRYLMDLKVPELKRKTQPILVSGGEILWVMGIRLSEKLRIRNPECRMIVIEMVCTD